MNGWLGSNSSQRRARYVQTSDKFVTETSFFLPSSSLLHIDSYLEEEEEEEMADNTGPKPGIHSSQRYIRAVPPR